MQNKRDNDDKADKDFDGSDKTGAAELASPVLPPRPECPQHKLDTMGRRWDSYTQQYHIQMHRSQLIIENIMNAHSTN